jgi:hypothetical protein
MRSYKPTILLIGFVLLISINTVSQVDTARYEGLRIGMDVGNFLINTASGTKNEILILGDYEFMEDKYATFEGGFSQMDALNDSTNSSINGGFGLLGIDFNLYDKKKRINDDILYIGLRYGYSVYSHNINLVEGYSFDGEPIETGKEMLSAQWAEFVAGGKAELWFLKNVFVGLSVRVKMLTSKKEAELIAPSTIPGFGNYDKSGSLGVNWTISYRIPFKKVDVPARIKKNEIIMKRKKEKKKLKGLKKKQNRKFR